MAKILNFDEFINESMKFVSTANEVEELIYDECTGVTESEIEAFLGLDHINEAEGAAKKAAKGASSASAEAFKFATKPNELKKIKEVLKKGSKGDSVKILQGQMGVVNDGIFGSETQGGLKKWQQISGIKVDGIFNPEDADKYIKEIKTASTQKASEEAKKIAQVIFDPTDPLVYQVVESSTVVTIGDKTYYVINISKKAKESAEAAKKKGTKGWEILTKLAIYPATPLILTAGSLYKANTEIVKGMMGAVQSIGQSAIKVSSNVWAALMGVGKFVAEKGKQALTSLAAMGSSILNSFMSGVVSIAKGVKNASVATANLFTFLYNGAKTQFKSVADFTKSVLVKSFEGVTVAGQAISKGAKIVYNSAVELCKKSASAIKDMTTKAYNAVVNGLKNTGAKAIATAKKIGSAAVDFGKSAINLGTEVAKGAFSLLTLGLFDNENTEGLGKTIFESYVTLESGEKFYVPIWKTTIIE